jgi:hypothetical protein
MDASNFADFAIIALVGGGAGLIGGLIGGADNLFGTVLMGAIGGIALSAIVRIANGPAIYAVGDQGFSLVWAAAGGFVLGLAISRSN